MRKHWAFLFLAAAGAGLCTFSSPEALSAADAACVDQKWNWDPKSPAGPAHWSEFGKCTVEQQPEQSPLKLNDLGAKLTPVKFNYSGKSFEAGVENIGYKAIVHVPHGEGGSISIDGKEFELEEFHVHTRSEHTLKGNPPTAAEVHFVNKTKDQTAAAVVGVVYDDGGQSGNAELNRMIARAPERCGKSAAFRLTPANLIPGGTGKGTYYAYTGSLTNPGCDRVQYWMVASTADKIATSAVKRLERIVSLFPNNLKVKYGFNNRPTVNATTVVGHREGEVETH